MAVAMSSYKVGANYDLADDCDGNAQTDMDAAMVISNIKWTEGDSLVEPDEDEDPEEIIGDIADDLNLCEEGCHECYNAWMSNDESNVYQVCLEDRPMRFGRPCSSGQDSSRCHSENAYCLNSFPYGDVDKYRSDDAACRTVPDSYLDEDNLLYGRKRCKDRVGLCPYCGSSQRCSWSYRADDPDAWRGYSAMCRCVDE